MTDSTIRAQIAQELSYLDTGETYEGWRLVEIFDANDPHRWTRTQTVVIAPIDGEAENMAYGFDYEQANGPDSEYNYWMDGAPENIPLRPIYAHAETITVWKYEEEPPK